MEGVIVPRRHRRCPLAVKAVAVIVVKLKKVGEVVTMVRVLLKFK